MRPKAQIAITLTLTLAMGVPPLEPKAQGLEEPMLKQQVELAAWLRGPAVTPAQVAAAYLDGSLPEVVREKIVDDALDGYARLLTSFGDCNPIPAGQAYEEIRGLMPQQKEGPLADTVGDRLRAVLVLSNDLADALCFGVSP